MTYYAIIVAGGTGNRMNSDLPKQFLPLNGKPILMHTIEAFYYSDLQPQIILVLNSAYHDYWITICREYKFDIPLQLVNNGEQRFHSVKNALMCIKGNAIIAIHDAVRPIVTNELITRTFTLTKKFDAVIPVVTSKDSVRRKAGDTTVAVDREEILLVQTPQVFKSALLQEAYLQEFATTFTDDASVVEQLGITVHTTTGSYQNIKITYPEDLLIAELYLKNKA